jgi:hypothetical protein
MKQSNINVAQQASHDACAAHGGRHDNDHHGHHHAHHHAHAHGEGAVLAPRLAAVPDWSLLQASLELRLVIAAALSGLIWLGIVMVTG